MEFFNNIPDKNSFKNPVVTIGNFDGVHLGHQKIISVLLDTAKKVKGDSVVITFADHPRKILSPENAPKIITTASDKVAVLEKMGVDRVLLLNFTIEMSRMNALEFYNEFLVKRIGAQEIVIGYDHAFGRDREGNVDFLKELSKKTGIGITRVQEEIFGTKPVSSTWLRKEITEGNMCSASELLGRNYSITGIVVKGAGRGGQSLGFPTANIVPDDQDKMIPKNGVYAVKVILQNGTKRTGMLNIGFNPTFGENDKTIEVNIFGFEGDVYGQDLKIEFFERLRDERRFSSKDELVEQLKRDRISVVSFFNAIGA